MDQQSLNSDIRRAQDRSLLKVLPLVIVIGLGLTTAGFFVAKLQIELWLHGHTSHGEVIALHSGTSNSSGRSSYKPEVEFTTASGEVVRFIHRTGQHPAAYAIGETVQLSYLPNQPSHALIDEALMNLLLPSVLLLIGPALAALGLRGWMKLRRRLALAP